MSAAALAKALAGNSARLVTSLIKAATHPFQIINAIRARFKGLNMGEVSQIYWEGWNAWNAAQDMLSAPPNAPIPTDDIPTNPYTNDQQQAPDRYRYTVQSQYQLPGETFPRTANLPFTSPQELTLSELQAEYEAWLQQQHERYPAGGWGATSVGALQISFTILAVEKRF